LFDNGEWPSSIDELQEHIYQALTSAATSRKDASYVAVSRGLAEVASAAFCFAALALGADEWQMAYGQCLFLKSMDLPDASFRLVYGDDLLIPGQVANNFRSVDEWYSHLEHVVMPARARALLNNYGEEVEPETRELWESIAHYQE